MLSPAQLNLVQFCAEEVERQDDVALAVYWLVCAWLKAKEYYHKAPLVNGFRELTPRVIEEWGKTCQPIMNEEGFRRTKLFVKGREAAPWEDIPELMKLFCADCNTGKLLPIEAYKKFEIIHPFSDGNGRVGKLIYNFLLGTLHDPRMPPRVFGDIANP